MTKRPFLLAIAGGSGAGKTTLAAELAARFAPLKTAIISEDHYYQDNAAQAGFDPASFNFDAPEAIDHALLLTQLRRLRNGQPVDMPGYDFCTHRRLQETTSLVPVDVIIIEGNLVLHHEFMREMFDYRVYLDLSDDIRLIRRIRRDVAERERDLLSILRQYEQTVRPMHHRYVYPSRVHADRVVSGDDRAMVDDLATLIMVSLDDHDTIRTNSGLGPRATYPATGG